MVGHTDNSSSQEEKAGELTIGGQPRLNSRVGRGGWLPPVVLNSSYASQPLGIFYKSNTKREMALPRLTTQA